MATEICINPEPLQSFFNTIEAKKTLLSTITDLHKTLTQHFTTLQKTLNDNTQKLDSQIQEFNQNTRNALHKLRDRENALPDRQASLGRLVEEKKAKALEEIGGGIEGSLGEESLPELLRVYFRQMDSGGVVRLLLVKRKVSATLKAEMAAAAHEAVDPMRLVLDAVEEFVAMKAEGKAGLSDWRWACGILVRSVVPVSDEVGGVGRSLKSRALGVLERWKGILGVGQGSGAVGAIEATMFLQMVIGFGLKDKFENKFLRKLVVEFASRTDMPRLAMALGFENIMGDIIDELVKSGKEIEAVYFAHESKLTEQFSSVTLLRSCLRNCRRNANDISKGGGFSAASVDKANNMELEKTKAIIKCVEDHKLESEFSIDSLKKRVTQLEKAKAEKKKNVASVSKPSNKRPYGGSGRGGGTPSFRPTKAGRYYSPSSFHQRTPQPQPVPAARYTGPYNYYSSQNVYDVHGTASYGQASRGAHTRSPVGLAGQYSTYTPPNVGGGPPQGASSVQGGGPYRGQASYDGQSGSRGAHTRSPVGLASQYPPYTPPNVGGSALQGAGPVQQGGGPYPDQVSYDGQSGYGSYGSYDGQSGYGSYDGQSVHGSYVYRGAPDAYSASYPPQ